MTNPFYTASGEPGTGAFAASAPMRSEFQDIQAGFDLMPLLTAGTAVVVNGAGSALANTVGKLALAGDFATTGAFAVTLAASAAVVLTLPGVAGTLATLAGTETFSNKTFGSNNNMGTPTALVGTNITGTAVGLTAGSVTTNANLTGMVTSSGNVTTVVTNANLTGVITSVGNATSIASQTGTGTKFVVDTTPTIAGLTVTGNFTATGLVTNADLASSTISGISLGSNLGTLTFGTHLVAGGTSYNGSTGVTITSDATNSNTNSTIVARDGSGNFSAGTITASLTGAASLNLLLAGGTMGGAIAMGGFAITGAGAITGTTLTSTISTGTAPFTVASTTNVANLNASSLSGATFASPGAIGSGSASTGAFTTLTATTLNGNTFTAGSYTLTGTAGKTLTFSASLTLAGTDGTTITHPSTSATMARTDAGQTFTGVQTFSTPIAPSSVATMTATVGGGVPTPPNNTTTFLRGDGTFAAVTFPGATSGTGTTFLQSDVALSVGVYGNGPNTGSIGASGQAWLLMATATLNDSSGLAIFQLGILSSTLSAFVANPRFVLPAANDQMTVSFAVVVTLSAATTFTLQAKDESSGSGVLQTTGGADTAHLATSITAVRIS